MNSLHEIFVKKLKELYSAEQQIVKALPKMAEAATNEDLKAGFEEHLAQTEDHINRLETVAEDLGEKFSESTSVPVFEAMLAEGEKIIKQEMDADVKDAALIAAAQEVEHHEIACYGTVIAWAKTMEHDDVVDQLVDTLNEEKETNEKLSKLAEGGMLTTGINEEANE